MTQTTTAAIIKPRLQYKATDICKLYQERRIDVIPPEYLDLIMNVFMARLTPNLLFPERPAERCKKKYLNNLDALVERYLNIAETKSRGG